MILNVRTLSVFVVLRYLVELEEPVEMLKSSCLVQASLVNLFSFLSRHFYYHSYVLKLVH